MIERLFWAQNHSPNTPNTIVDFSGAMYTTEVTDTMGYELFQSLLTIEERSKLTFRKENLTIKNAENQGYVISSNFDEVDDSGRRMGFIFYTPHHLSDDVMKDLAFFLGKINRNLSKGDLTCIAEKTSPKSKLKNIILIATVVVAVTLLLWILFN